MKNLNTNIIGVGCYHPQTKYTNEDYIDYYNKQNFEVDKLERLYENLGRKERYLVDNNKDEKENVLTMACESSREAMKNAGVTEDMIDMIVFVSETPEYLSPTNALKLSHMLGTRNAHMIYDMNGCCTGAITAIDLVSRYMKSNKDIKTALITANLHISPHSSDTDIMFFSTFGEGSGTIIVQSKEEDEVRGFIDSTHVTNTEYHWSVLIPGCGFSNIHRDDIDPVQKMGVSVPYEFDFLPDEWTKMINKLLEKNDLKIDEIDHYIFSQFSITGITETMKRLDVGMDKITFVGDKYGYTGSSSPIFALRHARENGKIKEGSKVIILSIGSGYNASAALISF